MCYSKYMPFFSLVQSSELRVKRVRTTNCAGFTLVEILVVIAMIAIISALVAVNFKGNREEQLLQRDLFKIQSTLKLAQANASSSVVCGDLGGGANWEVGIDPGERRITVNCLKGEDTVEERNYLLEEGVNISFTCSQTTTNITNKVFITYSQLSGVPTFSGLEHCSGNFSGLVVKLESEKDENIKKEFTISSGGAINAK